MCFIYIIKEVGPRSKGGLWLGRFIIVGFLKTQWMKKGRRSHLAASSPLLLSSSLTCIFIITSAIKLLFSIGIFFFVVFTPSNCFNSKVLQPPTSHRLSSSQQGGVYCKYIPLPSHNSWWVLKSLNFAFF